MGLEERVSMIKMRIDKFKKDYPDIFRPSTYDTRIWNYKEDCFYAPKTQ